MITCNEESLLRFSIHCTVKTGVSTGVTAGTIPLHSVQNRIYWLPALYVLQRSNALEPSVHHNGQPGAKGFTFFHTKREGRLLLTSRTQKSG